MFRALGKVCRMYIDFFGMIRWDPRDLGCDSRWFQTILVEFGAANVLVCCSASRSQSRILVVWYLCTTFSGMQFSCSQSVVVDGYRVRLRGFAFVKCWRRSDISLLHSHLVSHIRVVERPVRLCIHVL